MWNLKIIFCAKIKSVTSQEILLIYICAVQLLPKKMNIKNLLILITVIPFFGHSQNSAFVPSGKPFATIFANFHQGITGSAKEEAAFELVRGYLGYEYNFSPEFYAKINVDVGSPNDLSLYSKARRYAYFKNAYLRFMHKSLTIDFGLIDMRQFKLQEAVWERR